jgi:glycolate oxidase
MSTTLTVPTAPASGVSHAALVARMKAIVGNDNVLTAAADMAAYELAAETA